MKSILVIYPEVDITKIAVYRNTSLIFLKSIKHKADEMAAFTDVTDQLDYRTGLIMQELTSNQIELADISVVMARGGLIKPVKSGIYQVNEAMKRDLRKGVMGRHATNLGGLIGDKIASQLPDASHVYHQYVIRHAHRDSLRAFLSERKIHSLIHYPVPIHLQPAYANLGLVQGDLPVTEQAARQVLSLPLYPEMSEESVEVVSQAVIEFCRRGK